MQNADNLRMVAIDTGGDGEAGVQAGNSSMVVSQQEVVSTGAFLGHNIGVMAAPAQKKTLHISNSLHLVKSELDTAATAAAASDPLPLQVSLDPVQIALNSVGEGDMGESVSELEGGGQDEAIQLLASHGITMLPEDPPTLTLTEAGKLALMSTNSRVHNPANVLTVSNVKTLSPSSTIKSSPGPRFTKLVSLNTSAFKSGIPLSKMNPVSGITGTNNKPIRVIKLTTAQAEALKRGRAAGQIAFAKDKLLMSSTGPASVTLDKQEEKGVNKEKAEEETIVDVENKMELETFAKDKLLMSPTSPASLGSDEELETIVEVEDCLPSSDDDEIDDSIPSINELLAIPMRNDDEKIMEEMLDKKDKEIKKSREKHEKEMEKVRRNMELLEQKKRDREARYVVNANYKQRLAAEITQPVLKRMFDDNLDYLKSIRDGQTQSSRHIAFNTNQGTRQALLYTVCKYCAPFTDLHMDWTLDCMKEIWMKTAEERAANLDYIQKVLIPEFMLKLYMDFFNIPKEEAQKRIAETPLDEDEDEDDDSGNESKSIRNRSGGRGQRGTGRGRVRGGGGVRGGARGRARGGARGRARGGAQGGAQGGAKSGARVRAQPKLSAKQLGVGSKIEIKKKTIGGLFRKFKVDET